MLNVGWLDTGVVALNVKCELSYTQCVVSPLDLRTICLSALNLRTVVADDCPEDSVSHVQVHYFYCLN